MPILKPQSVNPTGQFVEPPGILLALNNVSRELEADYNLWYEKEAIPTRLALPGFVGARRYAVPGNSSYMTFYECDSVDAIFSDAYRAQIGSPTEWRMRVRRGFRNLQWSVCRETWSVGSGVGGGAVIVQCSPVRGREDEVRSFLADQLAPRILNRGDGIRVALWEADSELSAEIMVSSKEHLENYTNWVLFIESANLMGTSASLHTDLLSDDSGRSGLLIGAITRYALLSAHRR